MGTAEYLIAVGVLGLLVLVGVIALVASRGKAAPQDLPPSPAPDDAAPVKPAERPAPPAPEDDASRLVRLRRRLVDSQSAFGRGLLNLLSRDQLDESAWTDLEDTLITADLGVERATELVDRLRARMRAEGAADPRGVLADELLDLVDESSERDLDLHGDPAVILVVGVNGAGKTTTVGKLARSLVAQGHSVILGAADTFRAAAADQLTTWGNQIGVEVVRGPEGGDPASVAFDTLHEGIEKGVDVVIVDTAGRLQNKAGLMDELGKVKRVLERQRPVNEVLLVLDATTGQNGLAQARVFGEAVDVSGIVLTKLDGSAKGGIVVSVQHELGVPVKYVGLGEGPDDLAPFRADEFVEAIVGTG